MSLYDLVSDDKSLTDTLNEIIGSREVESVTAKKKYGDARLYVFPIAYNDLLFNPLSQIKCIQCGFYGRTFHCGPWVTQYYKWRKIFSNFNLFLLIGGYIDVQPRIEENEKKYGTSAWRAHFYAGNEGTQVIKSRVNRESEKIVNQLKPYAKKIINLDTGGGCQRAILPETELLLSDGSVKNANDIKVGDILVGYDLTNNILTNNTITEKYKRETPKKVVITTETGKKLRVSYDHPVYVKNHDWSSWIRAIDAYEDDEMLVLTEKYSGPVQQKVKKVDVVTESTDCHDIEVTNTHNFFADGVLVHNCRPCRMDKNESCRYPRESNPSPEGTGIDLYAMMSQLFDNFQIPPKNIFWSVRMIVGNITLDEYEPLNEGFNLTFPETSLRGIEGNILGKARDYYNSNMENVCKNCDWYSPLLCDRNRYIDEDLYETIKNLNVVEYELSKSNKTVKGIEELHRYQLELHRKGYWWATQMLDTRCPICDNCSIGTHRGGAYKRVSNRRIPFCYRYFNLDLEGDEYKGYILV